MRGVLSGNAVLGTAAELFGRRQSKRDTPAGGLDADPSARGDVSAVIVRVERPILLVQLDADLAVASARGPLELVRLALCARVVVSIMQLCRPSATAQVRE